MQDRTRGWFPLSKYDRRRLIEEGGSSAPSMLSVWAALLEKANDEGTQSLRMRKALIAHTSGLSYRWVGECLKKLETLGMLSIQRQGKHEQPDEPSIINLFPTVNPAENKTGGRNCVHGGAGTACTGGQEGLSRSDCPPDITIEQTKEKERDRMFPSESDVLQYGSANGFVSDVCHDFYDHYTLCNWLYGKGKEDISSAPKWKAALRRFSRHIPKLENSKRREIWMISSDLKAIETEMRNMWAECSFEYESGRERYPSKWGMYQNLKKRAASLRKELAAPVISTPPMGPCTRAPTRQGSYNEVNT